MAQPQDIQIVPFGLEGNQFQFDQGTMFQLAQPEQQPEQFYPYMVPMGPSPQPQPLVVQPLPVQPRGTTQKEMASRIKKTRRSNTDLIISLVVFLVLLLAVIGVIIWLVISNTTSTTTTTDGDVLTTTIQFDIVRPLVVMGPDTLDPNTLLYLDLAVSTCNKVKAMFTDATSVTKCIMTNAVETPANVPMPTIQVTLNNNGLASSKVLEFVQVTVVAGSAAETETDTVSTDAFTIASFTTGTPSAANIITSPHLPLLLAAMFLVKKML